MLTKLPLGSPYPLKIPVYGVRGGIRVPIRTHKPVASDMKCKEAEVIRKGNECFVYICVERRVRERIPKNIFCRHGHKADSDDG